MVGLDAPETKVTRPAPACRFCGSQLRERLVDLGSSPPCESFLGPEQLDEPEMFYPLLVWICGECLLAQLEEHVPAGEIFTDYAYFSAYSSSWVEHARRYTGKVVAEYGLGADSFVVELASNDGYLLQHFVQRGIPSLGIDPAANVVAEAAERGVETLVAFFDSELAAEVAVDRGRADLIVANNVLAQVPDLNDFVAGIGILLAPTGVATIEVPHLVRLIEGLQFDTIYHEHYSYFSLTTLVRVFDAHGLEVFDVEELASHGGSLRIHVKHREDQRREARPSVAALLGRERESGYHVLDGYRGFESRVIELKWSLLELLIRLRREGKQVVGYGAPGKANTLLNFCGIRSDLLEYTVDRNPHKQGKFLPGTRIPIYAPSKLDETQPDVIVILPWNLEREIAAQLADAREWGARLVVPVPQPGFLSWPDVAERGAA